MVQGISGRSWQAEARTEETERLIQDIKRITRRSGAKANGIARHF